MAQDKRLEHIKKQIVQLIEKYEKEREMNAELRATIEALQKDVQQLRADQSQLQEENDTLRAMPKVSAHETSGFLDKEKERYLNYIEKDIDWLVNL